MSGVDSQSRGVMPATDDSLSLPARSSLRFRLTVWIVLICAVIQVSLAIVYKLYQARSVEDLFNTGLVQRATLIANTIRDSASHIDDRELDRVLKAQPQSDEFVVDLLDEKGNRLAGTGPSSIKTDRTPFSRFAEGRVVMGAAPRGAGAGFFKERPVRGGVYPFDGPDGKRYVLLLARDDTRAQELHAVVSRVILVTVPLGIIATCVSAYIIAGIVVRPIIDLRRAARQLSPESISQHVEVPAAASEVAEVRRELELARQRIEAAFSAQERFLANVSHEFKTPIAIVMTEAQAIDLSTASRPVRDFVRSVREELERLAKTVDSFLLLTRVRHGKLQVASTEVVYIRDVLVDAYASSVSMAKQHDVQLDLRLIEDEQAESAVLGNPDLLRVIFDNLIRNAVRFSPKGEAVTIAPSVEGDDVVVKVRDRGSGIPVSLIPRIFDRFAQAKDEERRGRGHGLGLEIAMGIAELHSGTIDVRNCDDGGCEFTVKLPLYNEADAPKPPAAPATGSSAPARAGEPA